MKYCCVPKCRNRRACGRKLYMARFPSTKMYPELNKIWIENISKYSTRENWRPCANAVVCEAHFTKDMWENIRTDGTRKLKRYTAVPIIFNGSEIESHKEVQKDPIAIEVDVSINQTPNGCDHNVIKTGMEIDHIEKESPNSVPVPTNIHISRKKKTDVCVLETRIKDLENQLSLTNQKLHMTDGILRKMMKQRAQWKNTFISQKKTILKLKEQAKLSSATSKVFNKDQIDAMMRKTKGGVKWSSDTIRKALRLKFACGSAGYDELLAQKIPIPSQRTLRRKIAGINVQEGLAEKVLELMGRAEGEITDVQKKEALMGLDEMTQDLDLTQSKSGNQTAARKHLENGNDPENQMAYDDLNEETSDPNWLFQESEFTEVAMDLDRLIPRTMITKNYINEIVPQNNEHDYAKQKYLATDRTLH